MDQNFSDTDKQHTLDHLEDTPCIVCGENTHNATQDCPKLNTPIVSYSWLSRAFNANARMARDFIKADLKKRKTEATKQNHNEHATSASSAIPAQQKTTPAAPPRKDNDSTVPSLKPATMSSLGLALRPKNTTKTVSTETSHSANSTQFVLGNAAPTQQAPAQQAASNSASNVTVQDTVKAESTESSLPAAVDAPTRLGPKGDLFRPSKNLPHVTHSKYPARRGFAASNQEVMTNHFEVGFKSGTRMFVYEIDGIPSGKSKRKTKAIFKTAIQAWDFLRDNQDSFATDNLKKIVSWKNLHESITLVPEKQGDPITSNGTTWRPISIADGATTTYSLTFKLDKELNINDLKDYADPRRAPGRSDLPTMEYGPIVDALNIAVSKSFTNDVVHLTSNKFFLKKGHAHLSQSLCTMRGYFYTIRPGMEKILLNVNAATSAFFAPIMVSQFIQDGRTFSPHERDNTLRKLRVFINFPRRKPSDPRDQKHTDYLNEPHNRVKIICELGEKIESYDFVGSYRDENGDWHDESHRTKVVDHLQQSKYFFPISIQKLTQGSLWPKTG